MTLKKRILNILFWSVISAAFIGPGTITTASKAGAVFGFDLLWALVFSTVGCLLLQEAAARITMASGMNLGQAITRQFEGKSTKVIVLILIVGAIIVGCAAYQTGNLLGAASGAGLIFGVDSWVLVLVIGVAAAIALCIPSLQVIARLMGLVVAVMGVCFLTTAVLLRPGWGDLMRGSLAPTIPAAEGGGLLILGLIGTTIVPYNLFLGSGISDKNQSISEMRFGLSVAIILGGIISMAVLVVGTAISGEHSLAALAQALSDRLGRWAGYVFGIGLFAAGFSSGITAPLASAITAKSLFGKSKPEKWQTHSWNYRLVWGVVLVIGVGFGCFGKKPEPAIILAQALNGLILPLVSIFLLFVVNDPGLMGKKYVNRWHSNILLGLVVWVTLILGLMNIVKASIKTLNYLFKVLGKEVVLALPQNNSLVVVVSLVTLVISMFIWWLIYARRRRILASENC